MATATSQAMSSLGIEPTMSAAAAGGDEFANTGLEFVLIKNGGVGAITLTVATQKTVDGLAVSDRTLSVSAGGTAVIGPFNKDIYNDSAGKVQLTYSGVTSVTFAVLKVADVRGLQ